MSMLDDEADEADKLDEVAEVDPPGPLPTIPLDASEGDAVEQSLEVPIDDDERG
jgi:hypothetical protein